MRISQHSARLFILLVTVTLGPSDGSRPRWWGRACCELSSSNSQCRSACRKAKSPLDLSKGCHDENSLMGCALRQDAAQKCCHIDSKNISDKCLAACRVVAMGTQVTSNISNSLTQHCGTAVTGCFLNYTQSQPNRDISEGWRCCDQGSVVDDCRSKCRQAVSDSLTEEHMVEEIITHCGVPDHSAPLWQCFLRLSSPSYNRPQEYNIDSARLMCCSKAKSDTCRNLCQKTFTTQYFETSHIFHEQCSLRYLEHDLNACLDQVSNDCRLGCSDLSFCKNFNNRPTEMFRSCNADDDASARQTFELWSKGYLTLPNVLDFKIAVKDINSCEPEMWKSVACVVHIKPCQNQAQTNTLCRSDCERLMSHCLDRSTLPPDVDVKFICEKLFPHSQESSCISVLPYIEKSKATVSGRSEITIPCNHNPCQWNEICLLNTSPCDAASDCLPYKCVLGCPLGEVVTQVMPVNSYVRIPSHDLNCHKVCKCGRNHRLQQCSPLGCSAQRDCTQKSGRTEAHNSWFSTEECHSCFCYDGNIICPRCNILRITTNPSVAALPCNCEADYDPVCAWNGVTYGNLCLAKCREWLRPKFLPGACSSINHCQAVVCPADERCTTTRSSCIGAEEKCRQYACVKSNAQHQSVRAATSEGPISLRQRDAKSSQEIQHSHHHSHLSCNNSKPVCGMDGNTYSNECAAQSADVPVDYHGECSNIGRFSNTTITGCSNVMCAPVVPSFCKPIYPPNSCCPICAGELRLLSNPHLVRAASQAIPGRQISLSDVTDSLRTQIKIAECALFGYISYEGDAVIIIKNVNKNPTTLQVKGCMVETEKIGSLLSSSSPTVTTYLPLSIFMSVNTRTSEIVTNDVLTHRDSRAASCRTVLERQSILLMLLVLLILKFR